MMEQSRISAAQAAIAEVKARASNYYASQMLSGGGATTAGAVQASVAANSDVGSDYVLTAAASGSNILITVTSVKGNTIPSTSGTWYYPTT